MFKKLFLIVALLSGWGANSLLAGHQIPVHINKDDTAGSRLTYAPPRPWYLTQDDFTLDLLDEDGVAVYSVYVPAGRTLVVLPPTLSCDF